MGFSNLRVRLHGKIARIELIPEELEKAVNMRNQILKTLQECGFSYILLTLKDTEVGVWIKFYESRRLSRLLSNTKIRESRL